MKFYNDPFVAIRRIEKARRSIQRSLSQFEETQRAHLASIDVTRHFEVFQRDVQKINRDIDQNRKAMRRALQDIDRVRQASRHLR